MELKLNIYKKGQVIKTLTTSSYDLTLGVCEDLIGLLGLEKYASQEKLNDIPVSDLIKVVVDNFDKFIELLHDVFPDLQEEDRRGIKVIELKDVLVAIAKDTMTRLFNLKTKN